MHDMRPFLFIIIIIIILSYLCLADCIDMPNSEPAHAMRCLRTCWEAWDDHRIISMHNRLGPCLISIFCKIKWDFQWDFDLKLLTLLRNTCDIFGIVLYTLSSVDHQRTQCLLNFIFFLPYRSDPVVEIHHYSHFKYEASIKGLSVAVLI